MKTKEIREMSSEELEKELKELKSELFKLKFSLSVNGLENPLKIKIVKRDIAKIKTILRERELKINVKE
ncbi:MAG: 50S ribosomal protein L29 [Clostridia bacterium]|nr:50S ribosomal protein L29 [Clostridia bacterium]